MPNTLNLKNVLLVCAPSSNSLLLCTPSLYSVTLYPSQYSLDVWVISTLLIDRDLDPFLPVLSPRVCNKYVVLSIQLFCVCHLHSTDQILAEQLQNKIFSGYNILYITGDDFNKQNLMPTFVALILAYQLGNKNLNCYNDL